MSTAVLHEFLGNFHSRKLVLRTMLFEESPAATPPPPTPVSTGMIRDSSSLSGGNNSSNFNANVVMVLSVLLCALICSLGLNSIIRCVLRCSNLVASRSGSGSSARLANKGVKKKALKTFPTVNYSADLNLPGLDSECVICLQEFTPGQRVRLLPKCHHGFHVRCIDKWLSCHSSCPTCRHCLIETCQKIVGCNQQASSSSSAYIASPENVIVNIAPVQPEGLIRDYR